MPIILSAWTDISLFTENINMFVQLTSPMLRSQIFELIFAYHCRLKKAKDKRIMLILHDLRICAAMCM